MAAVSEDPRVFGMESKTTNPPLKLESLDQLLRYQAKEKELSKHQLKKWKKFKDDFVALKSQLTVIADKLTHPVMVPFGPKAFFPGQLKHTNEILLLLGDNWFVERTAKQATEIVDRRIERCNLMIEAFDRELKRTDNWLDQTKKVLEEAEDFTQNVEIIEEAEEEGWREEHKQKVKEYRKMLAEMRNKKSQGEITEEDTWARLDELELEEELKDELAKLGEESDESEENDEMEAMEVIETENKEETEETVELPASIESWRAPEDASHISERKKVTWSTSDSVRQFHNDEVLSRQEEDSPDTLRLTFRHSKEPKKRAKFSQLPEETGGSTGESASIVSSPSDIYQKFYGAASEDAEPKSILKVKISTTPIRHWELDAETADQSHLKSRKRPDADDELPVAVGDDVIERVPVSLVQEAPQPEEQVNTHRPVSRFKASRMNRRL